MKGHTARRSAAGAAGKKNAAAAAADAAARKTEARIETAPAEASAAPSIDLETIARSYCSNNLPIAGEARLAWQMKRLQELEAKVTQKSAELAARTEEAKKWLERQQEAANKAQDSLVAIYAKMKPESAAQQLAALNEDTAMAILLKLTSRSASAVLNEMNADRAARIASIMASRASTAK